ncbi:PolC-type DNA polymerase III [Verrucomicrobiota bacterium]
MQRILRLFWITSALYAVLSAVALAEAEALAVDKTLAKAKVSSEAKPITNITFVAFDLETTGFSTKTDHIIEIGAVKFKNGKTLDSKSWLINPNVPIPSNAQRVHGISDKMVANRPTFSEVFPEFANFAKGSVLLAHNAGFDLRMLSAELKRSNMSSLKNVTLDTLILTRKWYPDLKSHSLKYLTEYLDLSTKGMHRAQTDAQLVMMIFLKGTGKNQNAKLKELIPKK